MTNSTTTQTTPPTAHQNCCPFDVELAQLTRNGLTEATYRGRLVILSPEGEVALSLGDTHKPFFLRSALKPLQAIGSLKAGAPLRGSQVAIACGSHIGTF